MRNLLTIGMTVALVGAPYAHAQQAATLDDIEVIGATELLASFVKVSLSAQPGDPLSRVNPQGVELEVMNTGFFRSARAELVTVNGRDILRIRVVPNPTITSVNVTGASFLSAGDITRNLEERLNIGAGTTLNTVRIDESKEFLQQAYRQLGFPFAPGVSADVKEAGDGVSVTYVITETASVNRVEVTGNAVLPTATVQNAFRPLVDKGQFDVTAYRQALGTIEQAYTERGLQASGVDIQATTLQDGTLRVVIREARVGTIDTSALGTVSATLQARPGALLDLNTIAQDVRTLSNTLGRPVGVNYQADPTQPGVVNLVFVPATQASGPVREVRIAGATAVPTDEIAKVLRVRIGDIFNQQIAQEDYLAIQRLYRSRGFEITTRDPIQFDGGVLTYNVREVRISGYELKFEGGQSTKDRVILRELPDAGSVFNASSLRSGLERVARLGFVGFSGAPETRPDPNNPDNLIVVLPLKEQREGIFTPGIAYDTVSGWSGELGLSGNNLFGLGHSYNVSVSGAPNEVGEYVSASASYTIPWLDIDFLDFRRNRTSLSFNVSSVVSSNNAVVDPATSKASGYEYTQRSTGFGVSVGRSLTPNLGLSLSSSTQYTYSTLEPYKATDPAPITEGAAQSLKPQPGLTTLLQANLGYDTSNSPSFPTSGMRASSSAGYGFGYEGSNGLSWWQLEGGARVYYGIGRTLDDGTQQQAFALRANAGTILGTAPITRQFHIGGSDTSDRTTLRGYDFAAFNGKNFLTTSAEYRYNFNVNASILEGLYGVLFVDTGTAWNDAADFNLHVGYGLGVQLNLRLGNFGLPALRFDYAFSPVNQSGKFHFRLGTFF